jgi:PAS domain S-box-containing protein
MKAGVERRLFRLLQAEKDLDSLVAEVSALLTEEAGWDGLGIRVKQGGAYPLSEKSALPAGFVQRKNRVCPLSRPPARAAGEGPNPQSPGCMCSRVLFGPGAGDGSGFPEKGAVWTNALSADPSFACVRSCSAAGLPGCTGAGYGSALLAPLAAGGQRLGLLQILARRKNAFSDAAVELLERAAAGLSLALSRHEALRAFAQSEERYSRLIDTLDEGVVIVEGGGRIRIWNRVADAVFGISRLGLAGEDAAAVDWGAIYEDGRPFPARNHPSVHTLRTGDVCRDVVMGVPDGEGGYRWISINTRPIYEAASEKPDAVLVSFSDISKLRRAEREYQNLFNSMMDPFALHEIILDSRGEPADYRFLAVNPAFQRLTGLQASDLVGRRVLEILPGTERYWIEAYGRVALTGEPINFSNYSQDLGRHFEVTAYRPAPYQFACVFKDITDRIRAEKDRERLEEQLQQAQKMEAIGTLAGGIAHDFNNILASVLGYTELALEDAPEGSRLHQNLSEVLVAGRRARHLVDQILAISRQEKQEKTVVNLIPMVKEALKMLRATIPASIAIQEKIGDEKLLIRADPTQIHQVIMNLATNAKQAMPGQKGVLTVELGFVHFDEGINSRVPDLAAGPYALLRVRDTGEGICEAHLNKIFEPYFTTKKKGRGTGLGLSVVHGIVKSHQGHISVESEPGSGSTFSVYLPLAGKVQAESSDAAAPQELPGGSERILVVDDEAPIVRMIGQLLQKLGYRVTVHTAADEALRIFQEKPGQYDLVITDMTMPEMTGDQVAWAVKSIRPDVPVILCTGFSEAVEDLHLRDLGADHLLMKPLEKQILASAVRMVMDGVQPP